MSQSRGQHRSFKQAGALLTVLLCLGQVGCADSRLASAPAPANSPPYRIEIIVRTGENFHSAADLYEFVDAAARHGVATINLLVKQDEDAAIQSGQVYYASAIAPRAPGFAGFDVLQTLLDATHGRGIAVRAWVPQFHDQVAARTHPDWQMLAVVDGKVAPYTGAKQREYFVNPLNRAVQAYELSILAELAARYPVEGFMLDWIRFDNFNMDVSAATRREYELREHVDPLGIDFAASSPERDRWNDYRTAGLANYVHAVRAQLPRSATLGVYILPPEFVEVGQDAARFHDDVNLLAPMCYFLDWGFDVDWLWSSCLAMSAQKAGDAALVPTLDTQLSDAQFRQIFAHLRADYPQVRTIAWFYHGRWSEAQLARIAALSRQ